MRGRGKQTEHWSRITKQFSYGARMTHPQGLMHT